MWIYCCRSLLVLSCYLLAAGLSTAQSPQVTITPIYGASFEASIAAWRDSGEIEFSNSTKSVWQRIRRLDFQPLAEDTTQRVWSIGLVGQGQLQVDSVEFDGESVQVRGLLGEIKLPIEQVSLIAPSAWLSQTPAAARPEPKLSEDQLVIEVEGQSETIAGLLESISASKVVFSFQNEPREIPVARIRCVQMASAGQAAQEIGATISLIDGSRIFGTPVQFKDGKLELDLAGLQVLEIPMKLIASIEMATDQQAYLSDLEPTKASLSGLLLPPREWSRDQSLVGKSLRIFDEEGRSEVLEFAKGIALPSNGTLVFENPEYDRLVGQVGLDVDTRGQGDCEISLLVDDREVMRQRLRGTEPSLQIDVDLDGVSTVTLRVEAGERLELADHVNWCDLRFANTDQ